MTMGTQSALWRDSEMGACEYEMSALHGVGDTKSKVYWNTERHTDLDNRTYDSQLESFLCPRFYGAIVSVVALTLWSRTRSHSTCDFLDSDRADGAHKVLDVWDPCKRLKPSWRMYTLFADWCCWTMGCPSNISNWSVVQGG